MQVIDPCFSDASKLREVLLSVLERQAEKRKKKEREEVPGEQADRPIYH